MLDTRRWLGLVLPPLAFMAILIGGWEATVRLLDIKSYLLPAPSQLAGALLSTFHIFIPHITMTVDETVGGFVLAIIVGLACAMAIVESSLLERMIYPVLVATQVIPKTALAPLFLLWLGYDIQSRLVIAFLVAFFPITVNAILGMRGAEKDLVDLARSLRATKWQVLTKIQLPNSLPYIFSGLKVAMMFSLIGAVIGEFVGSNVGLGYMVLYGNYTMNAVLMFVALIWLVVVGLALFVVVLVVERFALPWYRIEIGTEISA